MAGKDLTSAGWVKRVNCGGEIYGQPSNYSLHRKLSIKPPKSEIIGRIWIKWPCAQPPSLPHSMTPVQDRKPFARIGSCADLFHLLMEGNQNRWAGKLKQLSPP